jgi:hypothetical protein
VELKELAALWDASPPADLHSDPAAGVAESLLDICGGGDPIAEVERLRRQLEAEAGAYLRAELERAEAETRALLAGLSERCDDLLAEVCGLPLRP